MNRLRVVALLFVVAGTLFGCGGSDDDQSQGAEDASSESSAPETTAEVDEDAVSNSTTAIDDVLAGRSHLGFVEGATVPRGLRQRIVARDRLVVVCSPGHPLARRGRLSAAELASCSFVLRERGSGTREVFTRALAAAGVDLPISVIEIGSTAAILGAVAAGDDLGVVSELAIRGDHGPALRTIAVDDLDLDRGLRAVWRAEHSDAVGAIVDAAAAVGRRISVDEWFAGSDDVPAHIQSG